MLLDTQCILPDGEVQTIPYRVVPNREGAELLMTNFRPINATKADYEEQLHWIDIELKKAKEYPRQTYSELLRKMTKMYLKAKKQKSHYDEFLHKTSIS